MQQGTTIAVREGSVVEGIDVRLSPAGVITGRVVDAYGEPLEGITVQVLQQQFRGGRTVLAPAAGAPVRRTDDRGSYRIHGLLPGTYYAMAVEESAGVLVGARVLRTDSNADAGTDAEFALAGGGVSITSGIPGGDTRSPRIFHPGSPSIAAAAPVRIEPGFDGYGIDITFASPPLARINGVAVDSGGQPVGGTATLTVSGRSRSPIPPAASASIAADGTFEFLHVPPGEYVLNVRTIVDTSTADVELESGVAFVAVAEAGDVAVSIRTAPGTRVRGKVAVDGGDSSVPRTGFAVGVVAIDPDRSPTTFFARGALNEDWRFELYGIVGPVRFTLPRAPQGWYLKSALIDGIDAADFPVTLGTAGQAVGTVDVVVARGGEIAGRVVDERGEPTAGASIVVFPTDPTRWYDQSRYLKLTRPTPNGEFSVASLPPGEYWVTAVDRIMGDATTGEWQSPDLLNRLTAGARRLRVDEAQQATTELRLVRASW